MTSLSNFNRTLLSIDRYIRRAPYLFYCGFIFILFNVFCLLLSWFWLDPVRAELDQIRLEEEQLKNKYIESYHLSSNLSTYQQQIESYREQLSSFLSSFEDQKQVPHFLNSIAEIRQTSRIEVKNIQWLTESNEAMYVIYPLSITLLGSYHELAKFIAQLGQKAELSTQHDFTLTRMSDGKLKLIMIIKMYRIKKQNEAING